MRIIVKLQRAGDKGRIHIVDENDDLVEMVGDISIEIDGGDHGGKVKLFQPWQINRLYQIVDRYNAGVKAIAKIDEAMNLTFA